MVIKLNQILSYNRFIDLKEEPKKKIKLNDAENNNSD